MLDTPPQILVRLGLTQPGHARVLNKASYGLRAAPTRRGEQRDLTLKQAHIEMGNKGTYMVQRVNAQGVCTIVCNETNAGCFVRYADDILGLRFAVETESGRKKTAWDRF